MLSSIVGSVDISFWPQIALVIFFGIFVTAAIQIFRMDKGVSESVSRLPLDESPEN